MNFEVYCDEAMPDLFTSGAGKVRYLMIGSLWLPAENRSKLKQQITALREKHSVWGEIKWTKVSPSKLDFYIDLIDLFIEYNLDLRFRCIAVDSHVVDLARHDHDGELGFYKFYYQVLHHWINEYNSYAIYSDTKTNRYPLRLKELKSCLANANPDSVIKDIQALPSKQVVLIQLSDLLLGAANSRLNGTLTKGSAKEKLVQHLERELGIYQITPTYKSAEKFNVFRIMLQGGW